MNVNMCTYHCPNWMNFKRLTAACRALPKISFDNNWKWAIYREIQFIFEIVYANTEWTHTHMTTTMRPWQQAWVCRIGNLNSTENFQLDRNLLCKRVYVRCACSLTLSTLCVCPLHFFGYIDLIFNLRMVIIWCLIFAWYQQSGTFCVDVSCVCVE